MKDFNHYNVVAFDIETADGFGSGSLDIRQGFIALMQIKLPGQAPEIIDPLTGDRKAKFDYVRKILSDPDNLIVGHNLKFDYKWLAYNGIFIRNLFDTMIASQILYAGLSQPDDATKVSDRNKKAFKNKSDFEPIFSDYSNFLDFSVTKSSRFSHSFDACMLRELNIEISKDEQTSDWFKRPLSEEQIHYALWDVKETDRLAKVLYDKIFSVGLEETFWLEMEVEPALAFKEIVGVGVDKEAWKQMSEDINQEVQQDKEALELELGNRLAQQQGDREGLFGVVPVKVNINSSVKMTEYLDIPDTQASTLKENEHKDPFISKYIDYKLKHKMARTYGETYLKRIGTDERLRGDFSQAYTATGRLASKNPNLQNVKPSMIKSLIRPFPGNHLVAIDFSTVELRILAYMSRDEKFIESCNGKDMHSENARLIFNIDKNEEVPKELRRKAKVVSFAIPYGTSAFGLFGRGVTDTLEEAQELIDNFYATFPKVASYLKDSAHKASTLGVTRDAIGRVRNYNVPHPPVDYQNKREHFKVIRQMVFDQEWDFRTLMDLSYDDAREKYGQEEFDKVITKEQFFLCKEVNSYEKQIAAIRREGQNHPVQASSASITKRAMADAYAYLRDTGYGILTLSIHDSLFYELNDEFFTYSYPDIVKIMEDAGPKIVPDIITPVDSDFGWLVERNCTTHVEPVQLFNQTLENGKPRFLDEKEIKDYVEETCAKEH